MMYTFEDEESLTSFLSENVFIGSEAANYLGISRARFSVLVREGRIKPFKRANTIQLFLKSELDRRKEFAKQYQY